MAGRHNELTEKQLRFCYEYMSNGNNAMQAAMAVGDSKESAQKNSWTYLKNPLIKSFIGDKLKKMEKELDITFEWKLKKLKHVVQVSIPDESQVLEEIDARAGVAAIAEMNKMQGHYSPDKHINANISADTDVKEVQDMLQEMIRKNEKEF